MQMNRILFFSVICATLFCFCHLRGNAKPLPNASSSQESERPSTSDEANWYSTRWGRSYRPRVGVVPNEKTAASIAEAILIPIYGDKQIQSEKPFRVTLQDNIWLIEGALPDPPEPRGNFVLRLSKVNGKVLFITHFQ
jgi:hypothetical protein